jgi:hypothetical protein
MTMPNPFDGLPDILAERSGLTCDQLAPNFERETGPYDGLYASLLRIAPVSAFSHRGSCVRSPKPHIH